MCCGSNLNVSEEPAAYAFCELVLAELPYDTTSLPETLQAIFLNLHHHLRLLVGEDRTHRTLRFASISPVVPAAV